MLRVPRLIRRNSWGASIQNASIFFYLISWIFNEESITLVHWLRNPLLWIIKYDWKSIWRKTQHLAIPKYNFSTDLLRLETELALQMLLFPSEHAINPFSVVRFPDDRWKLSVKCECSLLLNWILKVRFDGRCGYFRSWTSNFSLWDNFSCFPKITYVPNWFL